MALALDGYNHCAVVYIDNILIFSKTHAEHLEHLKLVFGKLQRHSYHARLNKCEFLQEEVEFLGHKISARGIATCRVVRLHRRRYQDKTRQRRHQEAPVGLYRLPSSPGKQQEG